MSGAVLTFIARIKPDNIRIASKQKQANSRMPQSEWTSQRALPRALGIGYTAGFVVVGLTSFACNYHNSAHLHFSDPDWHCHGARDFGRAVKHGIAWPFFLAVWRYQANKGLHGKYFIKMPKDMSSVRERQITSKFEQDRLWFPPGFNPDRLALNRGDHVQRFAYKGSLLSSQHTK